MKQTFSRTTWRLLHTIAAAYDPQDDQDKRIARDFFVTVGQMHPCTICRRHWTREVEQSPPDVESKDALTTWLYTMHNRVNKRVGNRLFPKDKIPMVASEDPFCDPEWKIAAITLAAALGLAVIVIVVVAVSKKRALA